MALFARSAALSVVRLGLDPSQRPFAIAFISIPQLGMIVLASATLAAWAFGRGVLPRLRIPVLSRAPGFLPARPVGEMAKDTPPLMRLRAAVTVVIGGFFLLLLAVPIQTILLVWLIGSPALLLPTERLVILGEAALGVLWVSYLIYRIAARRVHMATAD